MSEDGILLRSRRGSDSGKRDGAHEVIVDVRNGYKDID